MLVYIYSYVTAAIGLGSIAAFCWWAGRPNRMRNGEDDARAFFDEHGHWPDEDPSMADVHAGRAARRGSA